MSTTKRRPVGLTIIAIGKALKCVALVAIGIAAIAAAQHDPATELEHFADALRIDPGNRHLHHLIEAATGTSSKKLDALGIGSFAYAALFAVEGTGLWLQKRWAETLTMIITVSFIPLEIYEIVHHASTAKIVTLVLNCLAVVYLAVRAGKRRHERKRGRSLRGPSGALRHA